MPRDVIPIDPEILLRRAEELRRRNTPVITSFSPVSGWPGTIVTIRGDRFATARDGNIVMIGGARALVISASRKELVVLTGEKTGDGAITVEVNGLQGMSPMHLTWRLMPQPDSRDHMQSGAPFFAHGPWQGTPGVGKANPVLVILAYPNGERPANDAALRAAEVTTFQNAERYWREASHGDTQFPYDLTAWVELPRPRSDYLWVPADVWNARRELIRRTRQRILVPRGGGTVLSTHSASGYAPIGGANPDALQSFDWRIFNLKGYALAEKGDFVFVALGTSGFGVTDRRNSPHTFARRDSTGGDCIDLDIAGDLMAVADLSQGLLVYNVAIVPMLVGQLSFGQEFVTAVSIQGTEVIVGGDENISLIDVSTSASPTVSATVQNVGYVRALAREGSVVAAATESGGVAILEVGALGNTLNLLASARDATSPHDVAMSGTTLCVAAGPDGLLTYDVANPAAPALLSRQTLPSAAYGVGIRESIAYVQMGLGRVQLVDISNPREPRLRGSVVAPRLPASDPNLAALRGSVETAVNQQGFARNNNALMIDALVASGRTLESYEGLAVIVSRDAAGNRLRGASGGSDHFVHEITGQTYRLGATKGVFYMSAETGFHRIVHETAHWLNMWDVYQEVFADGSVLLGSAENWCMGGSDWMAPLFSAYQMTDRLKFYRDRPNTLSNIREPAQAWHPSNPPSTETFDLVAHGAAANTDPNRAHVLRIRLTEYLYYMVEVRQVPTVTAGSPALLFDRQLPAAALEAGVDGVVLVTKVVAKLQLNNISAREIQLFGALRTGESVVDAARGMRITVDSILQNRPLAYRVRLDFNQAVAPDPNGQIDFAITPWSTDTWESPDIWIDSPRNNAGATRVYEFHVPGDTTQPVLTGDRPWVKRPNTVIARVRNDGPQPMNNVFVSFYETSPPGLGDNGNWVHLDTREVPVLNGNSTVEVEATWHPDANKHSCIKVAALAQQGEISVDNNMAQENVFHFDSPGSSSHDPVTLVSHIRSPFSIWKRVDVVPRGLPSGWHAVIDKSWAWVPPKGEIPVHLTIWTDRNAPYSFDPDEEMKRQIETRAQVSIEAQTVLDRRHIVIGGILADVKANARSRITAAPELKGRYLIGSGRITPDFVDVLIAIEIIDPAGHRLMHHTRTYDGGAFKVGNGTVELKPGRHRVKCLIVSDDRIAEAETVWKTLQVPEAN